MNTLLTYNHCFNDFEAIFPSFEPLKDEIKQALLKRGIEIYKVDIFNDGWIRNHYTIMENMLN